MSAILKFIGRNLVSIALLVAGIIIGGFAIGKAQDIRSFLFPETTAYVRSPLTIVNSIQGIGQLVTVTSEIAATNFRVEIHQGFLNAGFYGASHTAIGAVEAGINFDAIDEKNLRFEDDVYMLTLPAPIITSCRIEHIDQNQHSLTLLQADWITVLNLAKHDATLQFARDMIEAGILERAEEETALRLGDFVRELTGKPAQIEFAARDGEIELPQSCQPIAPSGWEKDPSGAWIQS